MERAKADPELLRQLDAAGAAAEPIGAVFNLRRKPAEKVIPAEEVEARVHGLLQKVGQEIGTAPQQVHVFRNLGAFAVSAAAPFLRRLLEQDDVATATANRQSQEMLIKPVASEPVAPPPPDRKRK